MNPSRSLLPDCLSSICHSANQEGDKPGMMIGTEVAAYLQQLIINRKAVRILDIGTYLGFSAISFAAAGPGVQVTTLEIGKMRYQRATEWIRQSGFASRIDPICIDGLSYLENVKPQKNS